MFGVRERNSRGLFARGTFRVLVVDGVKDVVPEGWCDVVVEQGLSGEVRGVWVRPEVVVERRVFSGVVGSGRWLVRRAEMVYVEGPAGVEGLEVEGVVVPCGWYAVTDEDGVVVAMPGSEARRVLEDWSLEEGV